MKLFQCSEFDSAISIPEFQRANAEAFDDSEMTDIITQLESLAVNESMRLNLGCCGVFTFKRVQ